VKQPDERVIDPKKVPAWQSPDAARTVSFLTGRENCGAKEICTTLFWLAPGKKTVPDVHPDSEEVYYVVAGEADLLLEGKTFHVSKGMVAFIPAGVTHQSVNTGAEDLCYFCVFSPPPVGPWRHEVENWRKIRGGKKR